MHHPLFESVVLPLLLSVAGIGLLRLIAGPRRASAGVGLAVLLATIWMLGWSSRPAGMMQKLPWIFAGAWLLGAAFETALVNRLLQWLGLVCGWIVACWWLGSAGIASSIFYVIVGAWVLACLVWPPDDRAEAATGLVVGSLGLAGICLIAGSLALFQLCILLAAAVGGMALWLWPTPRVRFGITGIAVAGIAWLALAQAALLLVPARLPALALLAASFAAAPLLVKLWPANRPRSGPLAAAFLAGALAAGALAIQAGSGAPVGEGRDDGGYYRN